MKMNNMTKIQSKILNTLIDQYERSKTFSGENKVRQSFSVVVSKLFPKYSDSAEYDFYVTLNEDILSLEKKDFVSVVREKSGKIKTVSLNASDEVLSAIYAFINRTPRKERQSELLALIEKYTESPSDSESVEESPLQKFLAEQKTRIAQNKNAEHFMDTAEGLVDFSDILKGVQAVLSNEEEIFIRDFSVRVYGDSKRFEKLQSAILSILTKYGDFDERENVLAEYGIVKTPTYVCVKGNGEITLGSQKINLSALHGDIAFSTQSLKEIADIEVFGARVVTIENLTSFHDYKNTDDFVIYLGGFHNSVKRDFIRRVYEQNQQKEYFHFGDIDAGGFYILNHLKKRTGIPFQPMMMDIAALQKYSAQIKPLTQEDKLRLKRMCGQKEFAEFCDILQYMLFNNCKLEQENVIVE